MDVSPQSLRSFAVRHLQKTSSWHDSLDVSTEGSPETYLRYMSRDGTWGDERTLVALAELLDASITVHQATTREIYTLPPVGRPDAPHRFHLGHIDDCHYVAVLPLDHD